MSRDPLTREAGRLLRDLAPVMSEYRTKLAEVSDLRRRLDGDEDETTRDQFARARAQADQINAQIQKTLDTIERHAEGLGNSLPATWEDHDEDYGSAGERP